MPPAVTNGRVFSDQVSRLYNLAPAGIAASVINGILLVLILYDHAEHRALLIWYGGLLFVSVLRGSLIGLFRRNGGSTGNAHWWGRIFLVGLFAIGCVWGAADLLLYPAHSPVHEVFLAFLCGGMVAGSAGVLSVIPWAFLAFSFPALVPLIVRFFLETDETHRLMGFVLCLFWALMAFAARKNRLAVQEAFSLKLVNADLVTVLKEAHARIDKAHAELLKENEQRKLAQSELELHQEHLEEMVSQRTADLREVNSRLHEEIRKRLGIEEELMRLSRAKTEFIAVASHELRTPITSILGFAEILLSPDPFDESQRREFLQVISERALALKKTVDDLLDLSRVESKHEICLQKEPYSIDTVIDKVISLYKQISPGHRIAYSSVNLGHALAIDKEKIERVFENLISNAVKYSKEGSRIDIRRQRQEQDCLFAISDEGIGMTPEQVSKVFEKFYRVDAKNSATPGLGLGMNIVKQIVEAHGGRIWVESELEKGTTVFFTLPGEEGGG